MNELKNKRTYNGKHFQKEDDSLVYDAHAGNTHSLPTSLADGATVRCGFKYDGSDWILIALDE